MTLVTSEMLTDKKYSGHLGNVLFIGIHTMEAPEGPNTAENVANYLVNTGVQASAHWCVDSNSRVRLVPDEDSAWTMPPCNGYSMNIEMAGYAGQTSQQWNDAYSQAMLDNAAVCVAEWCRKFSIPVRHLTSTQIASKQKGIVGHSDVNAVFHASSHWDPGPAFPWDSFLAKVNIHFSGQPGPSAPEWPFGPFDYIGTARPDPLCHSGYYSLNDKTAVAKWENRMRQRGWDIRMDGYYDDRAAYVCSQFQAEKGLVIDSLVGPVTWAAAWIAPVT